MIHYVLFTFVLICLVTDMRTRKIYNNVVLGGIIAALVFNIYAGGLHHGIVSTVSGLFAGIGLLAIPFMLGGLGAGDVKMLGMIGAFTGAELVVQIMLISAIVGGLYALLTMIKEGGLKRRMKNIFLALYCFVFTRKSVHLSGLQDMNRTTKALPYGVVLAAGVVIIYIMGYMNMMLPGFTASPF